MKFLANYLSIIILALIAACTTSPISPISITELSTETQEPSSSLSTLTASSEPLNGGFIPEFIGTYMYYLPKDWMTVSPCRTDTRVLCWRCAKNVGTYCELNFVLATNSKTPEIFISDYVESLKNDNWRIISEGTFETNPPFTCASRETFYKIEVSEMDERIQDLYQAVYLFIHPEKIVLVVFHAINPDTELTSIVDQTMRSFCWMR